VPTTQYYNAVLKFSDCCKNVTLLLINVFGLFSNVRLEPSTRIRRPGLQSGRESYSPLTVALVVLFLVK